MIKDKRQKDRFIELVKYANDLLNSKSSTSAYYHEKLYIKSLFEDNEISNYVRLEVINSHYSTRQSIMSIKELSDKIGQDGFLNNEENFIVKKNNTGTLVNPKSLISKYFHFKINFNFPIYDSFVRETYAKFVDKRFKKTDVSLNEFKQNIDSVKDNFNLTYEEIDAFGWLYHKLSRDEKSEFISLIGNRKNFAGFERKTKKYIEEFNI